MKHFTCCLLALLISSSLNAQETSRAEVSDAKLRTDKQLPFAGHWKVVSQSYGPDISAIPNNDVFLSSGLFAEYDRINNPNKPVIALWNVKWTGKGTEYSTRLFRSPPAEKRIERFAEKNTAAFCYMQVRGNSAVLVISDSEIKGNPFVTDVSAEKLNAHARSLTLFRIDKDAKSRLSHLKLFAELVEETSKFLPQGSEDILIDSVHGGFFEEYKSSLTTGK